MSDPTVYWCVCRRYCKGVRKALHTRKTWQRHLREASSDDEKEAIRLAGRSEQFRAFVQGASHTRGQNQSEEQENGSPGIGSRRPAADDDNESYRRTSRRLSPPLDPAEVFSCVGVHGPHF
jgi:hypothetical protein